MRVVIYERVWEIVQRGAQFFLRDDRGTDTGPFSTAGEAAQWLAGLRQ